MISVHRRIVIKEFVMREKKRSIGPIVALLVTLFLSSSAFTSEDKKTTGEGLQEKALKVFLDGNRLPWNLIKSEITFINYVRDRKDADVHILVTTRSTGSGGSEYNLAFMGLNEYDDLNYTLKYFSNRTDVADEVWNGFIDFLKKGLAPFVARTPLADKVRVVYAVDQETKPLQDAVKDGWNYWIFSLNASGSANGVKTRTSGRFEANISANRVTPDWKIRFGANTVLDSSRYYLENETIKSSSERESFNGLVIKSLTAHWSAGIWLSLNSATFNNIKFSYSPSLAVEYSVFPYEQSTRRKLYVQYRLSFNGYRYNEETIYEKMSENLFRQSLALYLELMQPWGNASASIRGSHVLHDFAVNRLEVNASLSLRLFKGLSFWVSGGYAAIHDQISLPKADATFDQILLVRKDQATTYSYGFNVGLSFTFGSMFSNVVNPRFE
jgi:hypothetical protein